MECLLSATIATRWLDLAVQRLELQSATALGTWVARPSQYLRSEVTKYIFIFKKNLNMSKGI